MILKTHKQKAEIAEKILNSKGPVLIECMFDCGTRSGAQNSAMHLWFTQLAEAFNDAGYSIQMVLSESIDLPWDKDSVKSNLWKKLQRAMKKKISTTELNKTEPSDIYEHLNKFTAEKFGISVPWPCIETMREE